MNEDEIFIQLQGKLPIRSGKEEDRDRELLEILSRLILRCAQSNAELGFIVNGVWGYKS